MTLEEKVGQMIQPDLREVTPDEVTEYRLGTILNGGGAFPGNNKYMTAADWARAADTYYRAGERAYEGRGFRVPFAWATDAVHGHNNVFGATLFPHNIGLGAARDPDLVRRIGAATAAEVTATGLDWTFAPTVAVPATTGGGGSTRATRRTRRWSTPTRRRWSTGSRDRVGTVSGTTGSCRRSSTGSVTGERSTESTGATTTTARTT